MNFYIEKVESEQEDVRVPCGEYIVRLQYILNGEQLQHSTPTVVSASGNLDSRGGPVPIILPPPTTCSLLRAPILQEIGTAGTNAYRVLRRAATEEKVPVSFKAAPRL